VSRGAGCSLRRPGVVRRLTGEGVGLVGGPGGEDELAGAVDETGGVEVLDGVLDVD
jgi:hypothetical protein